MAKQQPKIQGHPWLKQYPSTIAWGQEFKEGPVYALLDHAVAQFPDAFCIDFLGKKYTYGEVGQVVSHLAAGLQDLGVTKGIKVGLFMPNTPYFVFFYYAILKAGGTVVNYNPLYALREVALQIEDSETEMMVTLDLEALYPKIHKMLAQTCLKKIVVCPLAGCLPFPKNILFPIIKMKEKARIHWDENHISFHDLLKSHGIPKPVNWNLKEDVAVLQYTGGTTGVPKGAMLTHANVYINVYQAASWFEGIRNGEEKVLAALPFFHVFAMTAVLNLSILCAAEIVMMFPRFNADDTLKLIQRHNITFFPAVPTIYSLLNNHPKIQNYNLKSLKACLSGGASLPLEVKRQFEHLTGCNLVEAYGLSETSPAATSNPLTGLQKAGSIGVPFPATIVKIMSLEPPYQEMPLGEKGEICIEGPQVMKGYWRRPRETEAILKSGLFHTGDVGYMDEDGYVFLVDRIKDMILCSGYNVYPRNVEEAIYLHSAVEEATVIGVPDAKRGETVKAFIKLKVGARLTEEELLKFLSDKLSPIEMPKMIEFRDALPKTMIGKLSKKELREEENNKVK